MKIYYDLFISYYDYDKQKKVLEIFKNELYDDNLKNLISKIWNRDDGIFEIRSFKVKISWIYSISLLNKRTDETIKNSSNL